MKPMHQAIKTAIEEYIEKHGYSPSVEEIGVAVGLKSKATVSHHVKNMIAIGILETDHPGAARALRVAK